MYRPETCGDLLKWGYLYCVKILSTKSIIQIFDDVIANHELAELVGITQHVAKYLDAHTDSETVGLNARVRGIERELAIQILNRIRLTKI